MLEPGRTAAPSWARSAKPSHPPDPTSIPWLLLGTIPTGPKTGALTPIYRSDTHGGKAPTTGCDAAHRDAVIRVPYTATYTFDKP